MPLSDLVRNVGDVLSRADTLFGTADPDAAATVADHMTGATDAIRSGQELAASMTGDAVTNYADFAQGTRDALDHLSGVESELGQRLQEAAETVTAAKSASQSALDVVSSASDALEYLKDSPTVELAVIHALQGAGRSRARADPDPPGGRRAARRAAARARLLKTETVAGPDQPDGSMRGSVLICVTATVAGVRSVSSAAHFAGAWRPRTGCG